MLAVSFFVFGAFRYRAVGRLLHLCSGVVVGLAVPSFHTVRLWMLRIGLARLQLASVGPRWAMIADHTATFGGVKMLVICGVDLAKLEQRVADKTGTFSLEHRDLQPLAIVPMKQSSGALLLEAYLECIRRHGHPECLVTDGGSDILKSARLLAEYQEREGVAVTRHTYDISHRIARIMARVLGASSEWQRLEAFVTQARLYCKYRARHLSPPSLSHGPDRWMNLSGILHWLAGLKARLTDLNQSQADQADVEPATVRPARPQAQRFGLTQRVWEMVQATYQKTQSAKKGLMNVLKTFCGKEYSSPEAYAQEVLDQCPALPAATKALLEANQDLNQVYLRELTEGLEECATIQAEVSAMMAFSNAIQKQLKTAGLTKRGVGICQEIYAAANLKGVGETVGSEIMSVIRSMAQDLGEEDRSLVTSDVIESVYGRWKMFINGSAMPALGVNALLVPALMGELTEISVKTALEKVREADVEAWSRQTYGVTFFQEKRYPIKNRHPEKLREVVL